MLQLEYNSAVIKGCGVLVRMYGIFSVASAPNTTCLKRFSFHTSVLDVGFISLMAPPSFHSYFSALNCGAVSAPYTPLQATFSITSKHFSSLIHFLYRHGVVVYIKTSRLLFRLNFIPVGAELAGHYAGQPWRRGLNRSRGPWRI